MKERVNRGSDENLYQPKIHSEKIRALYRLKELTGLPMTVLVDMAISSFLDDRSKVAETKQIYENKE
jgi:hypothetical protein